MEFNAETDFRNISKFYVITDVIRQNELLNFLKTSLEKQMKNVLNGKGISNASKKIEPVQEPLFKEFYAELEKIIKTKIDETVKNLQTEFKDTNFQHCVGLDIGDVFTDFYLYIRHMSIPRQKLNSFLNFATQCVYHIHMSQENLGAAYLNTYGNVRYNMYGYMSLKVLETYNLTASVPSETVDRIDVSSVTCPGACRCPCH